jgi:CheY-like chemotaxis protein
MSGQRLQETKSIRPRRILVVDDTEGGREPLTMLLQGRGYDVRAACDGFEALAIAAAFKPEVILLDIGMPQMDGFEVCSRPRATEGGPHVQIYALSGFRLRGA